MTPGPRARAARRLSKDLLVSNAGLWAELAAHPWLADLADGTLPEEAFIRWAQQRRRLAGSLRQAVLVMRSCDPPRSLDHWLARLLDEAIAEPGLLREILERASGPVRAEALPACLGYGSYLWCCAASGLAEGTAALYAMRRARLDMSAALPAALPPGNARQGWERHWDPEASRKLAAGLARCLDQIAGRAGPWQVQRAQSAFTTVVRWEYALLTACYRDERWPV